jgi:hypothetical protein
VSANAVFDWENLPGKPLWIVLAWIENHCVVPDGFRKGEPFEMYDWQEWCTANHYLVKPTAKLGQLAPAFVYRRSTVWAPQKTGKGPWSATLCLAEAAGPVVFDGFAEGDEVYSCEEWGCPCGWTYEYQPGEAMGRPWPSPLIQLTATSAEQVDNVYNPLKSMVKNGPLGAFMKVGEEFTRIGENGRIDVVTSSALSRLGNPIIFALQDESGTYTTTNKMRKVAETQRRGAAGMGGRSIETTNAPDPSEDSVAQRSMESSAKDVFRYWREPPKHLKWKVKAERRKILAYVYQGSDHIDLDGIEAEAAEIGEHDPAQAERFFGNRMVYGAGAWLPQGLWKGAEKPRPVRDGTRICLGFDGSDSDDWTAIRAETLDGYGFMPTFGPDNRPTYWNPEEHGGRIPRTEVHAAIDDLFRRYKVVRLYADPLDWKTEIEAWALKYGTKRVLEWATNRRAAMHESLVRFTTDLGSGAITHDADKTTATHVDNAKKLPIPGRRYILAKASQTQKIDVAMTAVLAHEAAADALASGVKPGESTTRRRAIVL